MTPLKLNLVLAQVAAPSPSPGPADLLRGPFIPMLLMLGAVFYMTYRSNKKRQKEQEELVGAIKAGDKVVTSSGLLGLVTHVRERSVVMRCEDSKLEILKSAITTVEKA